MGKAGIFIKRKDKRAAEIAVKVIDWMTDRGWECYYEEESSGDIGRPRATSKAEMVRVCALIVVLGGDGTMLATARALEGRSTPILGCNLGSLGFLTEITVDELFSTLEDFIAGRCEFSHRMMLRIRRDGNAPDSPAWRVLNDVVIAKSAIARIIDLEVFVDGAFLNTYKADGLIVATPTGSTAYSLAAGGPLVHPAKHCVVVTPLAPHALTARAIVVGGDSRVDIRLLSDNSEAFVTLDGQEGFPLRTGQAVHVERAAREVVLVGNSQRNFYDICRTKLKWGER